MDNDNTPDDAAMILFVTADFSFTGLVKTQNGLWNEIVWEKT